MGTVSCPAGSVGGASARSEGADLGRQGRIRVQLPAVPSGDVEEKAVQRAAHARDRRAPCGAGIGVVMVGAFSER